MRRLIILVALALAGTVAATEAAKPTSKPTAAKPIAKTQPPKVGAAKPTTIQGSAAKAATVKSSPAKGSTAKGSTVKTTGAQAKASVGKAVKPARADVKVAKADVKVTKVETKTAKAEQNKKATTASSTTASGSTTSATSTTSASTTVDFTATKVGRKLEQNSALRSKIEAKLQAAGYTGSVYEAAFGFKNIGQFNAATNQVQNHGYSFELLKVLMTGTYVDPKTHTVYRANQLADGTINLVSSGLATNPASTLSLGQSKQSIAAGVEMPKIVVAQTTTTSGTNSTGSTSAATSVKSTSKRKSTASGGSF
jgi:hypothetical protein